MMRNTSLRYMLLLAVGVFLAVSTHAQPPQPVPQAKTPATSPITEAPPAVQLTLEPKAIDLLQAASRRLAAARSMRAGTAFRGRASAATPAPSPPRSATRTLFPSSKR